jgi:atypical dual specificity phosphatase
MADPEDQKFWELRSELQEVMPRLYISNYFGAKNKAKLQAAGITHVVVCDPRLSLAHQDIAKYLRYEIDDNPGEDLFKRLPEILQWIDEARATEGNKVLVHCAAGVSRSGAVVTGYVMYSQKMR